MAQNHGVFLPKGSKLYYCTVQVNGKKHAASTKCTSKREAIAFARRWKKTLIAEAEAEAAAVKDPQMTFLEAANRYMSEVGEGLADASQQEVFFDWLVDRIGAGTPLSAIDNNMLSHLLAERCKDYRWGNVNAGSVAKTYVQRSVLFPLRAVLTRASDLWDIPLPRKPVWGRHKVKPRIRTRVMSWQEEAAIRAVIDPDLWVVVEFILLTGLRRRDVLLKWSNVDKVARAIRITVKGDRSHEVRITGGIQALLNAAAETGGQRDDVWTWVPAVGKSAGIRKAIDYKAIDDLWKATVKRAGLSNLTLHDLRRTCGERLYRATNDIEAVSRFLGHRSIELTRKYYVHVKPDDIEQRQLAMEWVRSKSLEEHAYTRTMH